MDIWKESSSNTESSKSLRCSQRSRVPCACEDRELSQPSSHRPWTIRGARYRRGCETSLAEEQTNGVHNEAGSYRYRSRRREGSRPNQQFSLERVRTKIFSENILAWQSVVTSRSHYPVLTLGYSPKSLAARTGLQPPSCAQFCPGLVQVL